MDYRYVGESGLRVSPICMGTMGFGTWSDKAEAFAILDASYERGINFFDTAELYSVPPRKETWGSTESIIGNWFQLRNCRDKVILASKVTGRSGMKWFRGKETRLNEEQILEAVEGSLKRLKTDFIDLYQLHWPERSTNYFGRRDYDIDNYMFIGVIKPSANLIIYNAVSVIDC